MKNKLFARCQKQIGKDAHPRINNEQSIMKGALKIQASFKTPSQKQK